MSSELNHSDLLDESLLTPKPRRVSCCRSLFRCFCCCCLTNNVNSIQKAKSKKVWAKIWAKISGKRDFDNVYMTLLHLYSQQPAISELSSCEISPDFQRISREDLEFYVPQIW